MTCIVGVTDGKTVTIGGDSAGVAGYDLTVRADAKVWADNGWVFGFTSSFRMGQLLRYGFTPPAMTEGQDLDEYMVTSFVGAVRQTLKDGGYASVDSNVERGGTFLVGTRGRLFLIDSDYQVGESGYPFDAVGCGESFALGALHAIGDKLTPDRRVLRALEIAETCSAGVRGPFKVASA